MNSSSQTRTLMSSKSDSSDLGSITCPARKRCFRFLGRCQRPQDHVASRLARCEQDLGSGHTATRWCCTQPRYCSMHAQHLRRPRASCTGCVFKPHAGGKGLRRRIHWSPRFLLFLRGICPYVCCRFPRVYITNQQPLTYVTYNCKCLPVMGPYRTCFGSHLSHLTTTTSLEHRPYFLSFHRLLSSGRNAR